MGQAAGGAGWAERGFGRRDARAVREMERTTAAGFDRSAIDENDPHTEYTYK
jgi:hypothetical protein